MRRIVPQRAVSSSPLRPSHKRRKSPLPVEGDGLVTPRGVDHVLLRVSSRFEDNNRIVVELRVAG